MDFIYCILARFNAACFAAIASVKPHIDFIQEGWQSG